MVIANYPHDFYDRKESRILFVPSVCSKECVIHIVNACVYVNFSNPVARTLEPLSLYLGAPELKQCDPQFSSDYSIINQGLA